MFEKVNRSLKYDSNIFFVHKHDIHIWTPRPITLPRSRCACGVMKLEVFILGGQRIDQKRKKGWWIGRRERIEKGSRERIEIKETKGN